MAQYFHIFANQATLNAHTNGNLAVGNLTGHVNFGTSIQDGALHQEINYIQQVTQIANSPFVSANSSRSNKVIFGSGVTLGLEDQNHQAAVYVNGQRMDHLRTSEVYQDAETPYIDFGSVFQMLAATSESLQGLEQISGVNTDFSEKNRRTIDVGQITSDQLSDSLPVVLTLTDENGQPLSGGTFELENQDTQQEVEDETTNQQGTVSATDLSSGHYAMWRRKPLKAIN